jgi:hypothetical protein
VISEAEMIKGFLIASTCLFWGLVTIFVVLEVRARRWLRRYPREWPEPVFDEQEPALEECILKEKM